MIPISNDLTEHAKMIPISNDLRRYERIAEEVDRVLSKESLSAAIYLLGHQIQGFELNAPEYYSPLIKVLENRIKFRRKELIKQRRLEMSAK